MYTNEEIAKRLREARETKNLSQKELSKLSGVPQSHISKIESGSVDLRVSSLTELARALGMELMLVPTKVIPAINSIVSTTRENAKYEQEQQTYRTFRRELLLLIKQMEAKDEGFPNEVKRKLIRLANQSQQLEIRKDYIKDLIKIRNLVIHSPTGTNRSTIKKMEVLIEKLVDKQNENSPQASNYYKRPAYSLEGK